MSIFMNVLNKIKETTDSTYNYILPKSGLEYSKAGFKAVERLTKDLIVDGLATVELVFKSFASAIPAGLKSIGNAVKGLFSDLPKAAYYQYQGNEAETNAALQQVTEDFSNAGNQFIEAFSTSVNTAYNGIKPILSDAATSIVCNGGEAMIDASAAAFIALIEGGQALTHSAVIPLISQLEEAVLETLSPQQVSNNACLYLFKHFKEKSLDIAPEGIEMSVINSAKAAAA